MRRQNMNLFTFSFRLIIFLLIGELFLTLTSKFEVKTEINSTHSTSESFEKDKNNLYILGDSFVEGKYLNPENRVANILSDSLQNYNVIDLSLGGNSEIDYINIIDSLCTNYLIRENDKVLVFWNINDVLHEDKSNTANYDKAMLFENLIDFVINTTTIFCYRFGYVPRGTETYELFNNKYKESTFEELQNVCCLDIDLWLIIMPKFNILVNEDLYQKYRKSAESVTEKYNLIDIVDFFVPSNNTAWSLGADDHHPNKDAVLKMTDYVLGQLISYQQESGE